MHEVDSSLTISGQELLDEISVFAEFGSQLSATHDSIHGVLHSESIQEGATNAIDPSEEISVEELPQKIDMLIQAISNQHLVGLLPDWEIDLRSDALRVVMDAHEHRYGELGDDSGEIPPEYEELREKYRDYLNWNS